MTRMASHALVRPLTAFTILVSTSVSVGSAHAAIPQCASHMQEPSTDGVLTANQIAINQACLKTLSDFEKVAEIKAKIEETEHKRDASPLLQQSGIRTYPINGGAAGSGQTYGPTGNSFERQTSVALPHPIERPRVAMIGGDATGHYTATLRMPDGGSQEVVRGSRLPDGSEVALIDGAGVYVRQGKTLTKLPIDDGQAFAPVSDGPQSANGFYSSSPGPYDGRAVPTFPAGTNR